METTQDIINRCRAKQRDWWKHLRSEGWHLCAICKKNPVEKSKAVCAFCDHKRRKFGEPKAAKTEHPKLPGMTSANSNLRPMPEKKEESDDN